MYVCMFDVCFGMHHQNWLTVGFINHLLETQLSASETEYLCNSHDKSD